MDHKGSQEPMDIKSFDYEAGQNLASFFILLDELDRKQKQRNNNDKGVDI